MKKFVKRLLKLLLLLLILAGIGTGGYLGYQWYEMEQLKAQRPKTVLAKDGTNTNPAWYSTTTYQKKLQQQYPFINKVASVTPRTWDGQNAVVPGLEATKSYDYETKKVNTATKMTPQGLTIAEKYLLITAYDGEHRHASVIYVLDKKTGKYLKTIQVEGKPHLGGITYDPVGKNIWITGSIGKSSALMSFSLKSLKKYQETSSYVPIKYNHSIPIPNLERASAVTYYDNQLFVGLFNNDGHGQVASYTFSRHGKNKNSIANNEIKTVTGTVSWSDPTGTTQMGKQIQGIAIYDDKIFLSQSYGSKNSKLYIFPSTAIDALSEKNAELVIDMPPYLEQITAYKGQLLCLFESGSAQYVRPNIMVMDRVLSLNINALFGN